MSEKPNLGSEQDMDRAIGHALAWWNHIEHGLGDIFCSAFGGVNNIAARNAYLSIVNFSARIKMVDAVLQSINLDAQLLPLWKTLRASVEKKAKVRNKITHFSRVFVKDKNDEFVIYVLPNFWDTDEWHKAMDGNGVRYNWIQIWEFGQGFGTTAVKLTQFARELEIYMQANPLRYSRSTHDPNQENAAPNTK